VATNSGRCSRHAFPVTRVESWEKRAEWPLALAALAFLIAFAWPILDTSLPADARTLSRVVDFTAWIIFVIDYLVRIGLAEDRLRCTGRHLLDLLIIALPVLRPLRLLRVVMLLRTLKGIVATRTSRPSAMHCGGQ
jgi:voltage-gated potassium channel